MANLKALKNRIKSVKSTQKITKAMKMVAASRLRKAKNAVESARPYATKISEIINDIAVNVALDGSNQSFSLLNGKTGQDKNKSTHLIIIISSDRGLCGNLNSATTKFVRNHINQLNNNDKNFKLLFIGKKSYEHLKRQYSDHIINNFSGLFKSVVNFTDAQSIANQVIEMFDREEFDICEVIYSQFKSAISQEQVVSQIIPANISDGNINQNKHNSPTNNSPISYEPSQEKILSQLLPKNIAIQIYSKMLENSASEQGARMAAMEAATNNAGKMIKNLTLTYNRTRQANITKELIDIISGANAV